jgi:hypothetical protein
MTAPSAVGDGLQAIKPTKPLGGKAYGSIGHLPRSRVGPSDWHIHEGQAKICLEKPRKGDRIIVCEKLDGACMAVANVGGKLIALSRAGYLAADAIYEHLTIFSAWFEKNRQMFARLFLAPGERVCGEWLAMAHGTIYDSRHERFSPFIAFDIIRDGKRVLRDEFRERIESAGFIEATVLHDGPCAFSMENAIAALGRGGFHGADEVEGAVWRVEREGRVDFLAKYVRPDKIDGKYLPSVAKTDPIWIVDPITFAKRTNHD